MENPIVNTSEIPETTLPKEEQELAEREALVARKKKRFLAIVRMAVFTVVLLIISSIVVSVTKEIARRHNEPPVIIVPPEEPPEDTKPTDPDPENTNAGWSIYKNDDLKVSMEYPMETFKEETDEENITRKVEFVYETTNNGGYIFRLSTFTTETRALEEVVGVKKISFETRCPEYASVSAVSEEDWQDTPAKVFSVTNCNSDYKYTYIEKFGQFYEFAQVYRGDIGYKHKYRMTTEEILNSVRFYPEGEVGLVSPYVTFTNPQHLFSFDHYRLNDTCCAIPGPESPSMVRIIDLHKPETYKDKENFDGISFFTDNVSGGNENTLEKYVARQKKILIDDYTVVRGKPPEAQAGDSTRTIAGVEALVLEGYTWQGHTLMFLPVVVEGEPTGFVIVIATKNTSGESFEREINGILDSLIF
jgi:hypothetical protein